MLIGGLAVAVHGYPRATRDVDLVYDVALDNAERLAAALRELGAEVVAADTPDPPGGITGSWLSEGGHFVLATDSGGLDALSATRGMDYSELASRGVRVDFDGIELVACSYEDLIAAKKAAGRPQDLADIEGLRETRGD